MVLQNMDRAERNGALGKLKKPGSGMLRSGRLTGINRGMKAQGTVLCVDRKAKKYL